MFLAPPLAPEVKRRLFARAATCFGLITALAILLALNIVLVFLHYYIVIPTVSPLELYHRTWQMARDNLYDQSLLRDWNKWEHKYDSKIHTEQDAIKYAREMIDSLQERATNFLDAQEVALATKYAKGLMEGVGITFSLQTDEFGFTSTNDIGQSLPVVTSDGYPVIEQTTKGSPAHKVGITSGDSIISINGQSTAGLSLDEIYYALDRPADSKINLEIRHKGQVRKLTLISTSVHVPIVFTKHLPGKIGYLRWQTCSHVDTADQVLAALEDLSDCDALIIDLRDNPGGFIHSACQCASYFLDNGLITTVEMRVPEQGYFKFWVKVETNWFVLGSDSHMPSWLRVRLPRITPNLTGSKPIVLLVNENTASAAELFVGALKDNGRTTAIVGTKTFGKGIGQVFVAVGNGCRLRVTNQKLWSPKGEFRGDCGRTISNGVVPDVIVQPENPESVFGSEDNQLKVAIEIATNKLAKKS